jgi:hypothetical protein
MNHHLLPLLLTAYGFLTAATTAYGQTVSAEAAPSPAVADYFFQQKDCVQEKLHLTLDRPYYAPGDTVWLRGTLVAADNLSYMIRTNYIYVELIDPMGDVRLRRKIRREGLCFQHCLPLDSTLTSGRYLLRGYTSWMRNFGSETFFNGAVWIVDPTEEADEDAPEEAAETATPDFDVSFLPEGGSRVAGRSQKIAFKALGDDGLPAAVTGEVYTRQGHRRAATFRSRHDGMGWFTLASADNQPDVALEATVTWQGVTDAAGMPLTRTFALPDATGRWALQVEQVEDSVHYRVLSADTDGEVGEGLFVVLHSGADLKAVQPVGRGGEGTLSLGDCRVGVSQLVLCTAEGVGLSRRLLFRQAPELRRPQIDCRITAPDAARQAAEMTLRLTSADGRPLRGDFAVSLLDGAFVDTTLVHPEGDLTSDLLLTSDLRGEVYDSRYYTNPDVPRAERAEALECLLLTHGWSRFATDTLRRAADLQLPHPLESNEWISGYVNRFFNRKDRRNMERVAISVVDTMGGSWGTAMLDSAGRFFVGNLDYPDRMPLMVRLLSYSANPHYHFDRPTFPDLSLPDLASTQRRYTPTSASADSLYRAWLHSLESRTTRLLGDVVVTDRRPGKGKVKYQQTFDAAELSQTIDLYDFPLAIDAVNELIRTHPALKYAEGFNDLDTLNTYIDTHAMPNYIPTPAPMLQSSSPHERTPRIILRNVKNQRLYKDKTFEALEYLYSEDIQSIELLCRDTNYITITFKPNTYITSNRPNRRAVTFYTFGYTEPQYFYHPRYLTRADRDYPKPDLRRTLSWFPSIQTDPQGGLEVRFYTSDHPTQSYLLQVEGVTFSGEAVSIRQRIAP